MRWAVKSGPSAVQLAGYRAKILPNERRGSATPRAILTYFALAIFFGISATIQLRRCPVGAGAAVSIYVCLLLLLALFSAPGFAASRAWLAARARNPLFAGVFVLPYLIYAAGTGDFRAPAFLKVLLFVAVAAGICAAGPAKHSGRFGWRDLAMLLWLAFPVVAGHMRGIWNVPVNLDFMARLLIVAVGSWSFLIWRTLDGVGYEFHFSSATARDGLLNFTGFSLLAVPLGLAIRFIAWNPRWRGSWTLLFDFVTIFIFIAVTEELYFRGLVQNLLENTWRSQYGAQAFTSVLFGFSHIHHAPFPNWRYVILASLAGWFYGSAWRKHRSLMASATTHALVDTVWRTWFTFPRI